MYSVCPFEYRSKDVKTSVGMSSLRRCREEGSDRFLSKTIRTGFLPYQFRTVNDGLSNKAVRLPTMMASDSLLFLCTSIEVSGVESTTGCPSERSMSMKPSDDSAHFNVM